MKYLSVDKEQMTQCKTNAPKSFQTVAVRDV